MARTISAELLATQKGSIKTPYFKYLFTSADGGTTVDYASRITGAELHYEAYNGYATILLRNNDNGVADIKGYWVEPVLGFDATGSGGSATEGPAYPRMWVKNYFDISLPGTKIRVLELEDQWKNLKERDFYTEEYGFGAPTFRVHFTATSTIIDTMYVIVDTAGMNLATLEASADDGFISTFLPDFYINENPPPYEKFQQIVYRLIINTKCYIRTEGGHTLAWFRVVYPQDSDSVDETYYSYQAHWFKEFAYKSQLVIPAHVHVYCDKDLALDADGFPINPETYGQFKEPLMLGHAIDQGEIDKYGTGDGATTFDTYRLEQAGDVHIQTDANFVAEAILDRVKLEAHGGRLVIPHDCRVELYDKVRVYNAR